MQKLHGTGKNVNENILCNKICCRTRFEESRLDNLDIPITENVPNEIIDLCQSYTDFVIIKVVRYFLNNGIVLRENPLVFKSK